jgi:hypothetical protein
MKINTNNNFFRNSLNFLIGSIFGAVSFYSSKKIFDFIISKINKKQSIEKLETFYDPLLLNQNEIKIEKKGEKKEEGEEIDGEDKRKEVKRKYLFKTWGEAIKQQQNLNETFINDLPNLIKQIIFEFDPFFVKKLEQDETKVEQSEEEKKINLNIFLKTINEEQQQNNFFLFKQFSYSEQFSNIKQLSNNNEKISDIEQLQKKYFNILKLSEDFTYNEDSLKLSKNEKQNLIHTLDSFYYQNVNKIFDFEEDIFPERLLIYLKTLLEYNIQGIY